MTRQKLKLLSCKSQNSLVFKVRKVDSMVRQLPIFHRSMERRVFWISTFESCVLNAEIPFTRSNASTRCTKTTSSNCFVIRNNPELGNGATFSQGQMELLITLLLLLFTTCVCVQCVQTCKLTVLFLVVHITIQYLQDQKICLRKTDINDTVQ